jgi:DnaK suppressor protein
MAERRSPLAVAPQGSPAPDEAAKVSRPRPSRSRTATTGTPAGTVDSRTRTAGTQDNAVTVISADARDEPEAWTVAELDDVRSELIADLERLERDVAAMQANITAVMHDTSDGAGDDQADTGAKAYEREHELTLLASTRETLFQSQYALARIAEGSYGMCEQCGGAIGKLRLQAFPRASLCVACKQRQERR